jgi:cysteinyl-tRNA synthetase
MLRVLNTQTRTKEDFSPLDPAGRSVRIYTCGPTVYDSLHLGHARAGVVPDVVRRYLEHQGYQVRYVTNLTDVDDKILKRALAEKRAWREIAATYSDEFHRVMALLNVKPADAYPRATDHVPEMLEIVKRLLDGQHAYVARDGDIYFDTASYARYGALSGRRLEEEEAGLSGRVSRARIEVKKNPGDFVLWKLNRNDPDEWKAAGPSIPHWPSPWGDGRPGWHLECSAMSHKYLGVPFDIHCGGMDLVFPHHEDEKAQTECAYPELLQGRESVRYWIHNAFVNVKARPQDGALSAEVLDAESGSVKMSKSLGNVLWLRQMIRPEGPCDPMAVRMMLLSSHYRSPIIFEPGLLDEAIARLDRLYNSLEASARAAANLAWDGNWRDAAGRAHRLADLAAAASNSFHDAMDDDFNTAGALAAIFDLAGELNRAVAAGSQGMEEAWRRGLAGAAATAKQLLGVLGIRAERAARGGSQDSDALVELLLRLRQEARQGKLFALADHAREGLAKLGYQVEDLPGGRWTVKKRGP